MSTVAGPFDFDEFVPTNPEPGTCEVSEGTRASRLVIQSGHDISLQTYERSFSDAGPAKSLCPTIKRGPELAKIIVPPARTFKAVAGSDDFSRVRSSVCDASCFPYSLCAVIIHWLFLSTVYIMSRSAGVGAESAPARLKIWDEFSHLPRCLPLFQSYFCIEPEFVAT